jgi:thiamine pyrophosphate-dependent acetolactate synthase large subunit-like protein
VRVERDSEFEPALRAALVADRATVIQVALDRRWVSIDQTPD